MVSGSMNSSGASIVFLGWIIDVRRLIDKFGASPLYEIRGSTLHPYWAAGKG
jgi:hypothetical protein